MVKKNKQDVAQNIRDCGQALIDNAENIANSYSNVTYLSIDCHVNNEDYPPYISVNTDFIPENFIKRELNDV